nr:hypothetical protein [Tanacetum cinerariifolium]
MWSDQEKKIQKIDRLARSLLIQRLLNDIYSLIDSNKTAKDLWDALARHVLGSEYGEQDRKATVLYEYETFKATKGELLLDTYIRYLQVINDLKKCSYSKDNCELNFKFLNNLKPEWKQYATMMRQNKNLMDINIDALCNILKQNQGDVNNAMGLKKKTFMVTSDPLALIAEKTKRDMSKVKCYNCKKEGHFANDYKKVKVEDYEYYKTRMLLAKKDKDEQVLLAEDQACMESSSDSDQEINENMVFMAQIEKQNQGDVHDAMGLKKKTVVVTSDPLALIAEKTKVSKSKEKVDVSSDSKGSDADDFSELKKITALLSNAFNRRNFYSKPTNNNLRTSSTSQFANKKQEFVKTDDKKVEKKNDEKKRDMSKVKCYNCKKEGHFVKDCKKVKVKYYEYYRIKMLLAKKDKDKQVLLAEDQAWMESSSDSDKVINVNMLFMAQIEKVLLDLETSSSSADDKIFEVSYYLFESKSESEYETLEYYDNTTTYGFENPSYFEKAKDLRPSLYDKKVIGLGYTPMFLTHSDEALEIEKFKRIVQICLWIIDSGCSKHMTGNRDLLTNFVEKFIGTVRFGNNDFAVIAGYGDVVLGSITIKKVYYVKDGVDLLTSDRSSNLYTIGLNEVATNSMACLLAKAYSSQSWLWHQRLSHLNFATINNLVKNNLVQGLPKMKFKKDHLCFACEQGKIHQKYHKSKMSFSSNKPLYLLHMDLCGPMRVESINKKRYVLVVVDDCSQYTCVFFLYSKDEASDVIISFIKKTQVNL